MTSVEWQEGNVYGGHIAPKYNAVSYTWGRYDLDFHILGIKKEKKRKYREVVAIGINGVDWPVPRINPEQFSAEQFLALIHRACEYGNAKQVAVEHLWLDVACIDQNNGPQKMAEIGRQAVIFQGAQHVYVWLTAIDHTSLSRSVEKYLESVDAASKSTEVMTNGAPPDRNIPKWLCDVRTALDDIFIDPWFTSLWTLQEAFLCPHAYLLPKEGRLIVANTKYRSGSDSFVTLDTLCGASSTLHKVIEERLPLVQADWQANKTDPQVSKHLKYLTEVRDMLRVRGIPALASKNPLYLYSIAQYRRTVKDRDRVYGIQQVFGFRLGTSALRYQRPPSGDFNRFILEDQLGAAILETYPVASQIHNFTEPVEEGRGWRVSGSSIIPKLDIHSDIWNVALESKCNVSTKTIKGQRWGFFRGLTCDLARISQSWKRVHELSESRSPQQIFLDVFLTKLEDPDLKADPVEPIRAALWGSQKQEYLPRTAIQHRLSWGLNKLAETEFQGNTPDILLLGSLVDSGREDQERTEYHVGLIAVKRQVDVCIYWKRLGFCIWQYGSENITDDHGTSETAFLCADDRAEDGAMGWKNTEGLFG